MQICFLYHKSTTTNVFSSIILNTLRFPGMIELTYECLMLILLFSFTPFPCFIFLYFYSQHYWHLTFLAFHLITFFCIIPSSSLCTLRIVIFDLTVLRNVPPSLNNMSNIVDHRFNYCNSMEYILTHWSPCMVWDYDNWSPHYQVQMEI